MRFRKKIISGFLITVLCLGGSAYDASSNVKAVEADNDTKTIAPYANGEIIQFANQRLAQMLVEQMLNDGARPDLTVDNVTSEDFIDYYIYTLEINWTDEKGAILLDGDKVNLGGFEAIPASNLRFLSIDNDFKMDLSSFYGATINGNYWGPDLHLSYRNLNGDSETFDWASVKNTWKIDEIFAKDILVNGGVSRLRGAVGQNIDGIPIYQGHNVNLIEKGLTKDTYEGFEILLSDTYSADFDLGDNSYYGFDVSLLERLEEPVIFTNENGNELVYKISVENAEGSRVSWESGGVSWESGNGVAIEDVKFIFELVSGEYEDGTYTPNDGQYPNPKESWERADFDQSYFFVFDHYIRSSTNYYSTSIYEYRGYGYFVLHMESKKPVVPDEETNPEKPSDPQEEIDPEKPVNKDNKDNNEKEKEKVTDKKEVEKSLPETGASLTAMIASLSLALIILIMNGYYRLKR